MNPRCWQCSVAVCKSMIIRSNLRATARTAFPSPHQGPSDVILLDVLLPGCNGYEVARRLRASQDAVSRYAPILMLTACDAEDQVIQGLDLGADFYITKPFSFLELLARIKSLQRPSTIARSSCVRVDDLVFHPENCVVRRAGTIIDLTRTERILLACLLRSAGTTVSRANTHGRGLGRQQSRRQQHARCLHEPASQQSGYPRSSES